MYLTRAIEKGLLRASRQFPALLLTGARQVGKTTLLRHIGQSGRTYVSLDDPNMRLLANEDPALFLQRFPPPLLIDEIQYAPGLLPHVKIASDSSAKKGLFWLTGSQQYRIMEGVGETLAGRAAIIELDGLSSREKDRRDVDAGPFLPNQRHIENLGKTAKKHDITSFFAEAWIGSFPALSSGQIEDRDLFLSSYLQTYIQRDVHDLAHVGDRDAFVRFVRACAARTAQILNLSNLARDCDVSVPTAKRWLSVLTGSLLVRLLQPWHGNVTSRLVKTPKLYFMDTGLCSFLTGWTSPLSLASGAMAGAIFETFVFSEIVKSWKNALRDPPLWYYRDRDGREIDFLIESDGRMHPVEAKFSATVKTEWVQSFQALDKLGQRGHGAAICLCAEMTPIDRNATAIPVGVL